MSRLPAALAYKLIHKGCSPADLATLAMLWPRGGHVPQQTKAGRAIKPGQGASNLAPPLQPLPGASPPTGGDCALGAFGSDEARTLLKTRAWRADFRAVRAVKVGWWSARRTRFWGPWAPPAF